MPHTLYIAGPQTLFFSYHLPPFTLFLKETLTYVILWQSSSWHTTNMACKIDTVLALIIGTGKNNYFDHCSAVFRTEINYWSRVFQFILKFFDTWKMEHYSNVLKRKQTSILSFAANTPQHMTARPRPSSTLKRPPVERRGPGRPRKLTRIENFEQNWYDAVMSDRESFLQVWKCYEVAIVS